MNEETCFNLKKNLYSKMVLFRTCYMYIDDFYIYLDETDSEWIISLKIKKESPINDLDKLKGEFLNNLINEEFRDLLIEKTSKIKEMIVARALYGADNTINTAEEKKQDFSYIEDNMDDYIEDPLGIAIPWEEKYGKDDND